MLIITTFTSTLPDELLKKLNEMAARLKVPIDKIIESAIQTYLDQLKFDEYIKSFKSAAEDNQIVQLAEEGMEDYAQQLKS